MQYFYYNYSGEKYIFGTVVNGAGYYIPGSGSILGTLFTSKGKQLKTTRVPFTSLIPMSFADIKDIFPDFKLE